MQRQSCLLNEHGEAKPIRNFAVAVGLFRVVGVNIEVAAMLYRRLAPVKENFSTYRIFCGTQEIHKDEPETLFRALEREINGEGASISTTDLRYGTPQLLYGCVVPDDSDRENLLHAKVSFACEYAGGTLRNVEMTDSSTGGGGEFSEELLSQVEWYEIGDLMDRMRRGNKAKNIEPSPRFHQISLTHLLHKVALKSDDAVQARYAHLMERNQVTPSRSDEFAHIRTYMTALEKAKA